jgi:protein AbiQ
MTGWQANPPKIKKKGLRWAVFRIYMKYGIDFTKAVVVQQTDIECLWTIDKKEWIELNKNLTAIATNFTDYLKKFAASLENSDFSKLPVFKYSSLQYFIEDVKSVVNSL